MGTFIRYTGSRLDLEGDVLVRRNNRFVERIHLGKDPWCRHVEHRRKRVVYRYPRLRFNLKQMEDDIVEFDAMLASYEGTGIDEDTLGAMYRDAKALRRDMALWSRFLETAIPDWAVRAGRHRAYAHFPMYNFFARCGRAAEDLDDNDPALALLWGCGRNGFLSPPSRKPMRTTRKYLAKRRSIQLERLGFPPGCARILRKIPREELGTGMLWVLRNQLWEPDIHRYLRHLPAVTGPVLELLEPGLRPYMTFSLLEEVSLLEREAAITVSACVQLACMDDYFHPGQRFGSVEEMLAPYYAAQAADHDWGAPRRSKHPSATIPTAFPEPPLPGIPGTIEPLTHPQALKEEGRVMGHCIGGFSYRFRVAQGETYVYRVLAPERATATIVRGAYGCRGWQLDQCLGEGNTRAPLAYRHVKAWLDAVQIDHP